MTTEQFAAEATQTPEGWERDSWCSYPKFIQGDWIIYPAKGGWVRALVYPLEGIPVVAYNFSTLRQAADMSR